MPDLGDFVRDAFGDDDHDALDRASEAIARHRGMTLPEVAAALERAGGSLNRDVIDPEQPGQSFWPATVDEHRVLLAQATAELASALRTIRALHRCPHCDRPLVGPPDG